MKKIIISILLIFGVGIFVWFQGSTPKTAEKDHFRFRLTAEPPHLDWSLATDNVSSDIIFNLMEGLVTFDHHLNVHPGLATHWEISKDGKTYTFHIRKNVKWTDGKELTAHDFVFGWKRILDPKTASEYAYFLFDVLNAQTFNEGKLTDFSKVGVKALSDDTLEVTLWHPASYFLKIHTFWGTFPQRQDVVEKYGDHWTDPKNIVTLGPFKLSEWKHDYKVVLKANPNYWGNPPKLKQVTAYIVNEDSTALSLYETGKIDLLRRIHPLVITKYKSLPDYQHGPFLRGYYYGFNTTKKPFDDVRVRRAFSMSIDRTQFPEILQGNQIPTSSWVPKGMFGYAPEVGLQFNPQKAQLLLAQAGYPKGENFPEVTIVYDSRDDNKVVAENLQQQWKKNLNVKLFLENQEWKVHLRQLRDDAPHLWRLGWGADFPDPDNFLNLFTSYSGNNLTRWKNQRYDKLIELGASEMDPQKRLSYYKEAQEILTEKDVPIISLFMEAQNILLKPYVKGYHINAMGNTILKDVEIRQ